MIHKRPRDKGYNKLLKNRFLSAGPAGMGEGEFLELLLAYAHPRQDMRPLAKGLLKKFGTLKKVIGAPIPELVAFPDMDGNSAVLLKAVGAVADL